MAKKPRRSPLTNKQIADALRATGGFVTQASVKLGVTYQAIYKRLKNSPQLAELKREIDESTLDMAETKLIELIGEKNLGAICFYLKCKGRGRGYIEHSPEKAKDNETIQPLPIIDYRESKQSDT